MEEPTEAPTEKPMDWPPGRTENLSGARPDPTIVCTDCPDRRSEACRGRPTLTREPHRNFHAVALPEALSLYMGRKL